MTGAGSGERSLELAGNQKTISMNITLGENNKGIRAIARFYVLIVYLHLRFLFQAILLQHKPSTH